LVAVLGPTASGKSGLALKLAQRLGGEIVNCDSMQMIRQLTIGTAKPSRAEMALVPHHLYDVIDLNEFYSAGAYMDDARRICSEVANREKIPFVVGGTGLYLRALLKGIFPGPVKKPGLRSRLKEISRRRGTEFLHRMLLRRDPASAARIQATDEVRIVRALEVNLVTGDSILKLQKKHVPIKGYSVVKIGLNVAREELYDRINRRVEWMFDAGLLQETERLLLSGFPPDSKGFEALGYRHAMAVVQGELSLEESIELTQRETRRYAKRQMTWFRKEEDVHWIPFPGESPEAEIEALQVLEKENRDGV
jgi:tRNA dimethylallyltransferase